MSRYLIRTAINPYTHYTPADLARTGYIWTNSGNLVFQYGVMNILCTPGTEFVPSGGMDLTAESTAERVNETCDAVILPFADAFRGSFAPSLRRYTALVRRLKVPCHIIGIGLTAELEPDLNAARPFDEDVKALISAVLDHSAMVGVRGEITGRYLQHLGFVPEKHFTVIGCPSLYMHGTEVHLRPVPQQPKNVAFNMNVRCDQAVLNFISACIRAFPGSGFVQQREAEFLDMYYGISGGKKITGLDADLFRQLNRENRVRFFMNVPDWLHYMEGQDLFVGCRIHGTVAALLGGAPAVFLPIDSRTRELAEYHGIPMLYQKDFEGKTLQQLLPGLDFSAFEKKHTQNLMHYHDFLRLNGLPSLLDSSLSQPRGTSPMEQKVYAGLTPALLEPAECYLHLGAAGRAARRLEAGRVLLPRLPKLLRRLG